MKIKIYIYRINIFKYIFLTFVIISLLNKFHDLNTLSIFYLFIYLYKKKFFKKNRKTLQKIINQLNIMFDHFKLILFITILGICAA